MQRVGFLTMKLRACYDTLADERVGTLYARQIRIHPLLRIQNERHSVCWQAVPSTRQICTLESHKRLKDLLDAVDGLKPSIV